MEVVSFCLGIILAMVFKKIIIIVEVIMCLLTTYLMNKFFHPELVLKPVDDWTFEAIFHGYNFWGLTILFFILSWLLIYGLVPFLINKYLIKDRLNRFMIKYDKFNDSEKESLKNTLRMFVKPINYVLDVVEYVRIEKKKSHDFNPIQDIPRIMIHVLVVVIHASIILPFFIDAKVI
jgi:hypothetical protein